MTYRPREWDTVRVSGYCPDLDRFVYGLRGVVGYAQPCDRWFKVWPSDGELRQPNGDTTGKLWFDRRFARVELIESWETW